jgi:hypothetical protein
MCADIRELHCKNVFPTESVDCFQVVFGDTEEGDPDYLLIQGHSRDQYIETTDIDYCGHFQILTAELTRNEIRITYGRGPVMEFRVTFEASDANYAETARLLKILIPNLEVS